MRTPHGDGQRLRLPPSPSGQRALKPFRRSGLWENSRRDAASSFSERGGFGNAITGRCTGFPVWFNRMAWPVPTIPKSRRCMQSEALNEKWISFLQVVNAGGIPRLISLFANSGGGGDSLSARTNSAICLAKLAREPRHKKVPWKRNAICTARGKPHDLSPTHHTFPIQILKYIKWARGDFCAATPCLEMHMGSSDPSIHRVFLTAHTFQQISAH